MGKESDEEKMETSDQESISDEEDEALNARINQLETDLTGNKYAYNAHLELVALYNKQGDLELLRSSYERFSKLFPLTANLWLDWINVEIKIASSDEEKRIVLNLFNKAVEDYLSIKLWLEYLQFAIGVCNLTEMRDLFERAINAGGLHFVDGTLLWDTWREYELAQLSLLESESESYNDQVQKVFNLFKRQLSVPLQNNKALYIEFEEFINLFPNNGLDKKSVEWKYKNALKLSDLYEEFEKKLYSVEDDMESLDIFRDYIKKVEDPSTILCLYERGVEKLCLNSDIWLEYCNYASKFNELALKISLKAIRNVTWSRDLWVHRLRLLETTKSSQDDVRQCFEQAMECMPSDIELWLTYLEYAGRNHKDNEKLNKLFEQAEEQMLQIDTTYKIRRWHSRLLMKSEQVEKCRELWKEMLSDHNFNKIAIHWMEYLSFERSHGTTSILRASFKKALNTVTDWQFLSDEWLLFERERGTIEDVTKCCETIKKHTERLSTKILPVQMQHKFIKKRLLEFDEKGNMKRSNQDSFTHSSKRPKFDSAPPAKWSRKPRSAPKDLDPTKAIFVSNLSPLVTEDQLQEIFSKANITLIHDQDGKSRCFGYIQFKTADEATATLKRDRESIDGRPMFISECKVDGRERDKTFKYSETEEKNKLFVKGLPFSYTQEDVDLLFKPFNPKSVRLIFQRSGQSKGIAYIEFNNETDPLEAIKEIDQKNIDGKNVLSVAISAPPSKRGDKKDVFSKYKNKNATDHSEPTTSKIYSKSELKGQIKDQPISRPAERRPGTLAFSFVPTSVLSKQKKAEDPATNTSKSNSEFRNLLLGKKS